MPNPYDDHGAILALVRRKMEEWGRGRSAFLWPAQRNIHFYRGHQWIVLDRGLGRFRPAQLRRNVPRPVTNLFASTMDAVVSVLARIEPAMTFRPGTDEPEDRAAADVSMRAIDVIEDEVHLRVQRQMLAMWNGLTGGAWLETGYDADPIHGERFLPHEQCFKCQTVARPTGQPCPECGGRLFVPALDAQLEPLGEMVPRGRMYVEVVSPFEMFFDPSVVDWSKQRGYCRQRSVSVDEARTRWDHLKDKIVPDSLSTESQLYGEQLITLGPYVETAQSAGAWPLGGSSTLLPSRVTEQWFWQLPTAEYPEGLLAVVVNKTLMGYAGPLPYVARAPDGGDRPFLPTVFFPQKLVPGSAWPKTVADDLALKAAQYNRWESLLEQIAMRTANPVWLVPEGANVTNLTGEAGQVIRYNALGPHSAKPERIPGQGIPAGLINFMVQIRRDMEELAAAFSGGIKGSRPEGVSAGIALQIIQERNMSRYASMFILWSAAWAEWGRQAVEIFRQYVTEERLLRIKGKDGQWQVQKFLGADLQGRVDIIPEAISSIPRSTLLDRAEVEQLLALRVLNVNDPDVQEKILELYGRTNMLPGMEADTRRAIREDEQFEALAKHPAFLAMGAQEVGALTQLPAVQIHEALRAQGISFPRVRPAVDGHAIHAREHGNWMKSESFEQLPLPIQLLAEAHKAEHDKMLAIQMQAVAGIQGPQMPFMAVPPAGGPAGDRGNPLNVESSGARLEGEFAEMADRIAQGPPS